MDTTSTAGRGIDVEDVRLMIQAEQLLHAMIYGVMERERERGAGLSDDWHDLHSILMRTGEIGMRLQEVRAQLQARAKEKAEEAKKGAGLGDMTEAESALYNAITQEGD